jgi:hypothetical protein
LAEVVSEPIFDIPGLWKPGAISALIPFWAAGRPSEAMQAFHPASSSTSGGSLVLIRRLVLGNLNGGKHRAVHSLKGHEVTAGIDHRYVHFPIPLLGLCHRRVNNRLGSI